MKLKLLFLSCLFLTGCATHPNLTWMHPNRDFLADRESCLAKDPKGGFIYLDCLTQLGWQQVNASKANECRAIYDNFYKQLNEAQAKYFREKEMLAGDKPNSQIILTQKLIDLMIDFDKKQLDILEKRTRATRSCFSDKGNKDSEQLARNYETFVSLLEQKSKELINKRWTVEQLNQVLEKISEGEDAEKAFSEVSH